MLYFPWPILRILESILSLLSNFRVSFLVSFYQTHTCSRPFIPFRRLDSAGPTSEGGSEFQQARTAGHGGAASRRNDRGSSAARSRGNEEDSSSRRSSRQPMCYNCGSRGHIAKDCTAGAQPKRCHNCKSTEHLIANCPEVGWCDEQITKGFTNRKKTDGENNWNVKIKS